MDKGLKAVLNKCKTKFAFYFKMIYIVYEVLK